MNFLGHAVLSFGKPEILVGNLMGDYVKGLKILDSFPEQIKKGIILHRKIDEFTDNHPATLRAKNIFRPVYRLYSGAFVDHVYDHFLANDARYFSSKEELLSFSERTYQTAKEYAAFHPPHFSKVLKYIEKENWLYDCRSVRGLDRSFKRLMHKAKYLNESEQAFELSMRHYHELNQHYYDFIDDIYRFSSKLS